jgi:hypothetical protein
MDRLNESLAAKQARSSGNLAWVGVEHASELANREVPIAALYCGLRKTLTNSFPNHQSRELRGRLINRLSLRASRFAGALGA